MKSTLSVLLVTLCLGFAAGCSKNSEASSAAAPAAVKIGFLVKQPEEPWFQNEWKGAANAGKKFGFEVVQLGVPDGEKVMTAIDSLVANGAQGFVICTPDVRLGPAIMARAKLKGLKVITVDDRFVTAAGGFMSDVPYFGMSASKIGTAQGEALYAEMKKRQWVEAETGVCVVTFEELDTARERTDAAIAALKAAGYPADHIFKTPQKTTDVPGSFDAANILLTQHPAVKRWLIAGMNDTAVLGAVRATEGRGFTADTVIGIAINGTDCLDELRKSKPTGFFGSMRVPASYEGFKTSEMLYHWIKDGTVPPPVSLTPGTLITRENFEKVILAEDSI